MFGAYLILGKDYINVGAVAMLVIVYFWRYSRVFFQVVIVIHRQLGELIQLMYPISIQYPISKLCDLF